MYRHRPLRPTSVQPRRKAGIALYTGTRSTSAVAKSPIADWTKARFSTTVIKADRDSARRFNPATHPP